MKKILLTLFFSFFIISVYSSQKVYPLDDNYAIVAEFYDWKCERDTRGNGALGIRSGEPGYIKGEARDLPICFYFFKMSFHHKFFDPHWRNILNTNDFFQEIKVFLSKYAQRTGTIFSDLCIEKIENNNQSYFIVSGCYFDSNSVGKMHFYIKPSHNTFTYCMLIKIKTDFFDEQIIGNLFQETYDLITPLIVE
ncbi:MAG: hypothetical protein ACH350_09835 [Parachlamydiaceae bacterium]